MSTSAVGKSVNVSIDGCFASVSLNRPDVHNAFSDHVIKELDEIFTTLRDNKGEYIIFNTRAKESKSILTLVLL